MMMNPQETKRKLGKCFYCTLDERDKPIKFSTSEAAGWRAEYTRYGGIYEDHPESQVYIISFSLFCFLTYFMFIREESDIDELFDLNRNIYDKVDGLEEVQLKLYRQYKINLGEDVTEIDRRLKAILDERLSDEVKAIARNM